MTIWEKLLSWWKSWEGISATIAAAAASIIATLKLLPKIHASCLKFYRNATIGANLGEHMDEMKGQIAKAKEEIMVEIRAGFASLTRGQVQQIQVRRMLLDRETNDAFFECDAKGNCIWVSRLWRKLTGLDIEEAKGNGWEIGVAPEERDRVAARWADAIARRHPFEEVVTYIDRDGKRTTMKVFAGPIVDEETKDANGWFGQSSK